MRNGVFSVLTVGTMPGTKHDLSSALLIHFNLIEIIVVDRMPWRRGVGPTENFGLCSCNIIGYNGAGEHRRRDTVHFAGISKITILIILLLSSFCKSFRSIHDFFFFFISCNGTRVPTITVNRIRLWLPSMCSHVNDKTIICRPLYYYRYGFCVFFFFI